MRKKSPGLGDVATICRAWTEAHRLHNEKRPARDLAAIAGAFNPHQLTQLHFSAIIAGWKAKLSPKTVENYRNQLMRLVRHMAILANRPGMEKLIPKVRPGQPRKTIATPEEIEKLLAAAPRWMKVIVLLAAHAGFRRSDCMRVAPEHYNAQNRTITIRQQKTNHSITIPVTDALAQALDHVPEGSPSTPFYMLLRDKPITPGGLDRAWQRLKKKAGVNRDLWLHDLRRTIAVSIYEVSKDLRVVEQMLGHQSLQSTIRYLEHRDPAKLKPYLDAMFIPKGPVQ